MEEWRDIQGYEGYYQVSNLGRIKSIRFNKEKILTIQHDKDGYCTVGLTKNNKLKLCKVHRLVCKTFFNNSKNKPQVNHINGIKNDNRAENLQWCTCKENMKHGWKTGLYKSKKGSKHGNSKLTEKEVIEIRELSKIKTRKQIAKKYKISYSNVGAIINNKLWKHI